MSRTKLWKITTAHSHHNTENTLTVSGTQEEGLKPCLDSSKANALETNRNYNDIPKIKILNSGNNKDSSSGGGKNTKQRSKSWRGAQKTSPHATKIICSCKKAKT